MNGEIYDFVEKETAQCTFSLAAVLNELQPMMYVRTYFKNAIKIIT